MNRLSNEQMRQASPSIFDAQDGDLKTTVKVLESLAESDGNEFDSELLDAARRKVEADYL